jgi:predicted metal-binding membrane protein
MSRLVGVGRAKPEPAFSRRGVADAVFVGVCTLCFAASAAATIAGSTSMTAMGETPMPGGWTMSMIWTRMCGQTRANAAVSFIGMWIVMMVAMMLPSLVPMLWRYREAVGATGATGMRVGQLTLRVAVGYFVVWITFGIVVFAMGVTLAALVMRWPTLARAVPSVFGVVVLSAGALQFTAWKAHQLACCRDAPEPCRKLSADAGAAWRHGLRIGFHCGCCCAGLTAVLLVFGVMDLRAMAVVATAITGERVAPGGKHVARVTGAAVIGAGVVLVVRAAGLA